MTEKLTFTLFHDPARGTLTLPRAALRLSRLSGARRPELLGWPRGGLPPPGVPPPGPACPLYWMVTPICLSSVQFFCGKI